MSYWVVYTEQVTGELNVNSYEDHKQARQRQFELRHRYNDAVILRQEDINELYLQSVRNSKKKMLEHEKRKNI